MNSSIRWVILAAGVSISLLACKSESSTSPDTPELTATPVSPTAVAGVVGAIAPFSPTVKVLDARTQRPAANVRVHFTNGWVSVPEARTDVNGIASAGQWRFSSAVGTDHVSAYLAGRLVAEFRATLTHAAPATFRVTDGSEVVALAGTGVVGFFLQVVDQFGNGVADVPITFSASGGTLAKKAAVSGSDGAAATGWWVLDERPGTSELTVSADGVKPLILLGHGLDSAALRWFDLKEIRRSSGAISPLDLGILSSRFFMTPFNGCFCSEPQRGFYVEADSFRFKPGFIGQKGGRFEIVGTTLNLLSESELKSYFEGERLLIQRFYSLSDFLFFGYEIETWVFAPSAEGK
jgi:hypothetical protein